MSKKDFSATFQQLTTIQEVQTTQDVQEVQKAQETQKTQGRKGYKMQRINMAFTPDNIQFIRDMSFIKGITMTQYVNEVLNAERNKNDKVLKAIREMRKDI